MLNINFLLKYGFVCNIPGYVNRQKMTETIKCEPTTPLAIKIYQSSQSITAYSFLGFDLYIPEYMNKEKDRKRE